MRNERVKDILNLAIRLQGALGGMTMDDIIQALSEDRKKPVSRKTAERCRDTVEWVFGPLEPVPSNDRKNHWRLRSGALSRLVTINAEDLVTLSKATEALEQHGLGGLARGLDDVETKLRAAQSSGNLKRLDSDMETLAQAEGLAMRPGPRQPIGPKLLSLLREAILTARRIEFSYHGRHSGKRSRQRIEPYGLLYGTRPFLVGKNSWNEEPRLWRIGNMSEVRLTDEKFEQDPNFDLQAFARRSFGTFQEKPVQVELRFRQDAAPDAATFQFHPDQSIEQHEDGTLTVRFKAGGISEMCWHLVTWGDSVKVVKPARLRRQLAQMCENLSVHHRAG